MAKKVFQLNTQACSKVPRKHQQLDFYVNVHLEGIQLKSSTAASPAVTGYILVRNVAFEKSVAVRFTLDSWQTTSEVSARHQASLASLPDEFLRSSSPASFGPTISNLTPKSPEWDRFSFTIKLEDYAQHLDQKTMWLVVRYSVPGDDGHHEWWDNNGGANYKLGFRAASSCAFRVIVSFQAVYRQTPQRRTPFPSYPFPSPLPCLHQRPSPCTTKMTHTPPPRGTNFQLILIISATNRHQKGKSSCTISMPSTRPSSPRQR